jgi:hypothetical protein
MRICYFIQNHLPPAQAVRLVRALRTGKDPVIVVSHDPWAGLCTTGTVRDALPDVPVLEVRERARRGYFSLLEPYFDAVEWLRDNRVDYHWIVYLSAQDFPTRPLRDLESLLADPACDAYLRFWDVSDPENPWGRPKQGIRRYFYQYRDAPVSVRPLLPVLRRLNGVQPFVHTHLVYGPRVGVRRNPPFAACFGGKQWTTIRRQCAEYVLDRVRENTDVVRWFRRTVCPDEAVVQTLLAASGQFRLCDDDLRFADFAGTESGSPRELTLEDLPRILDRRYYFARKFGAGSEVVERLEEIVTSG